MLLRPLAAQWFEVTVPKADADDTMEALARHAEVQFEWPADPEAPAHLERLREFVTRYRDLAFRFARFWPPPTYTKRCCDLPLETEARIAVNRIEHWLDTQRTALAEYDGLRAEQAQADDWKPILSQLDRSRIDLGRLAQAGPLLVGLCLSLPKDAGPPTASAILIQDAGDGDRSTLLVLASKAEVANLAREVEALGGRLLRIPAYFRGDPRTCQQAVARRAAQIGRRLREIERSLGRTGSDQGVDRSVAVLQRIDWFLQNAQDIRCDDQLCWISGWTRESDRSLLEGALEEVGVAAKVAFLEPPDSAPSPSVTGYPLWLQPFEVFTQAIGVPGLREADPTTWVALLVPLLFGYMCGDVGHGLVILSVALLVRTRTPLWPLLALCGIAATAFGFVYGDIFGYEHIIEPLWVRPMDEPLQILLVPLIAGTLVLTLGVSLHLVGTCWRGEGGSRGVSDLAQLLVYWGLLSMFLHPRLGWLAVGGTLLCALNQLRTNRPLKDLSAGVGHLAQSTFELLLNTLSFARVGAFALAHAALESTVVVLAGSTRILGLSILIAVIGNLVVIVLEGLVVSIQTTRLVLFEFFTRFFEGEGRRFTPSVAPRPDSPDKTALNGPPA
jgi:V/A-type H+-transporting ATPase subunit I